jgi:hypothetical protein
MTICDNDLEEDFPHGAEAWGHPSLDQSDNSHMLFL